MNEAVLQDCTMKDPYALRVLNTSCWLCQKPESAINTCRDACRMPGPDAQFWENPRRGEVDCGPICSCSSQNRMACHPILGKRWKNLDVEDACDCQLSWLLVNGLVGQKRQKAIDIVQG